MVETEKLRFPDVVSENDQDTINRLWRRLTEKQARNALRVGFYDGKKMINALGVTNLPERIQGMVHPVGWPAKAVDTLNNRCHLEGFVLPGADAASLGIDDIWDRNHLSSQSPMVGLSSLIHAVSFVIVTRGAQGEPDALITTRDALSGTGEWNPRVHRLDNFLSVIETDQDGNPLSLVLYLADRIVRLERDSKSATWAVDATEHDVGYVPVEPLVHKPRLGREFGTSRITRPVMAYTNAAMRALLRSEVSAELYSMPQRIILGADNSMFVDSDGTPTSAWEIVWGKVLGLPNDEDGNRPDVKQMAQASQEPHMAQLRTLAQLFSGETSIPVTELGIHSDSNPASAEAVYAHQGSLIAAAEMTTEGWEPSWRRTMITALRIANDVQGDTPPEWERIRARFRNPAYESKAAAADAGLKTVQAFPWLAETDVGLELFFRDPILLERVKAERRRMSARTTAERLAAAASGVNADQ